MFRNDEIVFNPDAAKSSQAIEAFPVDIPRHGALLQLREQGIDKIYARLDCKHLARFQGSSQSQVWKAVRVIDFCPRRVGHRPAQVVYLDPKVVSEAMRKEQCGGALFEYVVGIPSHEAPFI